MRIGVDAKTLSKRYTGIAVYVSEMVRFFSELAPEDDFYLFSPKDFELKFPTGNNIHKVIYSSLNGSISVLFCFSKLLTKYHIDLFWGPEHVVPLFRCRAKRVVTIHDLAVLMHPELGTRYNALLSKLFIIPSCKKSTKIIAISKATANDVINLTKVDSQKVEVIYNGDSPYKYKSYSYTADEISIIRNKFNLFRNYFLFVGTIEPRKNIPTIVNAYNIYRESGGSGGLALVGGLGWKYKKSIECVDNSKYKDDIILTGYCTEMEKEYLYRNAIALLFPSICEGFGFPILEAMSVGTPVITANVSCMPEVGGDSSFYIEDSYDAASLAIQMKNVVNMNNAERDVIKNRCIERSTLFSRETCAMQILTLFHSL